MVQLKLYNDDMNGRPHSEDFISKKKLIDIGISFQYTIKGMTENSSFYQE